MANLTEWVKPNGMRLEINDAEATIEHARKAGWLPYDETDEGIAEAEAILEAKEKRAAATLKKAAQKKDK